MPAIKPAIKCTNCGHALERDALFCPQCGTARSRDSSGDPLIGVVIGDRFLLSERLGHGGSGTIYRAEHVTLRRKMAVKVLHHELSRDDLAVERFRREATTVSEIDNDHIVEIYDFGRTEDGRLYLAMELLEGFTLQEVIEREQKLDVERCIDVLLQLGEALSEAHAMGYVHRDLRPRNLWLSNRRGRADFVKLLDFGLAKLVEHEGLAASTSLGMTFGDPKYMSPEQARGEALDRRADIYSMGCIAYEMLAGVPPFSNGKVFDILTKHIDTAPTELRTYRDDIPSWLDDVVMRMLAKKPDKRFTTVMNLVEALRQRTVDPSPITAHTSVSVPAQNSPPRNNDESGSRKRTSTALYGQKSESESTSAGTASTDEAPANPDAAALSTPRMPARKTTPGLPLVASAGAPSLTESAPADAAPAPVPAAAGSAPTPRPARAPTPVPVSPRPDVEEAAEPAPAVVASKPIAGAASADVTPVAMSRPAIPAAEAAPAGAGRTPTPVPVATAKADTARSSAVERVDDNDNDGDGAHAAVSAEPDEMSAATATDDPRDSSASSLSASISASFAASRAASSSASLTAASSSPSLSNSGINGISGDWFADAEGDLDEHGKARLDDARAFLDADDTTLVNDAALYYEPQRNRLKIIGIAGGVLLLLVLVIVLWPSSDESSATDKADSAEKNRGETEVADTDPSNAAALLAALDRADAGASPAAAGAPDPAATSIDPATDGTASTDPDAATIAASPAPMRAPTPAPNAAGASRARSERPTSERRTRRSSTERRPRAAATEPAKSAAPSSENAKQALFFAKLGQQSLRGGNIFEAARHFKKALELDPKNADAVMGQGEIAYRQGSYANAISHYAKAARMRPRSARAHTLLGEAYLGAGNNQKAAKSFKRALSLRSDDSRAQRGYTEATGQPPP